VFFSSAAAVIGSRGQAAYAAANGFLDGFAADLRSRGVRAWSINWGAWANAGMAAALGEADRRRLRERGHGLIVPERGIVALEQVLARDEHARVLVTPVDWAQFRSADPVAAARPMFAGVLPAAAATDGAAEAPAPRGRRTLVAQLAPAARAEAIANLVREQALKVLGLPPGYPLDANQGFRDLGLDSLMAIDFKNRLQTELEQALPATLAFDYPTPVALTHHLLRTLSTAMAEAEPAPWAPMATGTAAAAPGPQTDAPDVRAMSEEEAEAQLFAELGQGAMR
jgi:myxalamid-type polyketide synthase MxaB